MSGWGGIERVPNPAEVLAGRWINLFGEGKQRFRFVKVFSELLEDYTVDELRQVVDVLHDRHKNRMVTVTSPAFIKFVADDILAGTYLEGKRLEIF